MIGNGSCQSGGEIGVFGRESQERHDCPTEILNVLGLGLRTAPSIRRCPARVAFSGSLSIEGGTNPLDGCGRRPDPS
jgi:hypothetical protein